MRLEPERFFNCGGGGEDFRAPALETREQIGRGKAEVEANDGRAEILQDVGRLGDERRALRRGNG
jgi:hypothetical protein